MGVYTNTVDLYLGGMFTFLSLEQTMSYDIKCKSKRDAHNVERRIKSLLAKSRFTANVLRSTTPRLHLVSFASVKLRTAKHYCGNHAGPCLRGGGRHAKMTYLEGADWVAFNDMVNDCLDSLSIDANAGSSHCVVRKGRERCTDYIDGPLAGGEWAKEGGDYEDHCGSKVGTVPTSDYPPGTPGIDQWRTSKAA